MADQDAKPAAAPATPPAKAADADADQAAIEAAVTPAPKREATGRDAAIERAHRAELERQADQAKAVAKANADELPKIGGPMKNPGLGR